MHLVEKWLPILDKKMEASFEHPHENYRLFISSEPAPDPFCHFIPQVLLFNTYANYYFYIFYMTL